MQCAPSASSAVRFSYTSCRFLIDFCLPKRGTRKFGSPSKAQERKGGSGCTSAQSSRPASKGSFSRVQQVRVPSFLVLEISHAFDTAASGSVKVSRFFRVLASRPAAVAGEAGRDMVRPGLRYRTERAHRGGGLPCRLRIAIQPHTRSREHRPRSRSVDLHPQTRGGALPVRHFRALRAADAKGMIDGGIDVGAKLTVRSISRGPGG